MRRPCLAAIAGIAPLLVPTAPAASVWFVETGTGRGGPAAREPTLWAVRARWSAELRAQTYTVGSDAIDLPAPRQIMWPIVAAEQALVLALGGTMFVWLRRRARREFLAAGGLSDDSPAPGR